MNRDGFAVGHADFQNTLRRLRAKVPPANIRAGSLGMLLKLVEAGYGIGAVPESVVQGKNIFTRPLPLTEAVFLNLLAYQKQPEHLRQFIKRYL